MHTLDAVHFRPQTDLRTVHLTIVETLCTAAFRLKIDTTEVYMYACHVVESGIEIHFVLFIAA